MGRMLLAMTVGINFGLALADATSHVVGHAIAFGLALAALVVVWRDLRREHPPTTHHHHHA